MKAWHFRFARALIYAGAFLAASGIVVASVIGQSDLGPILINLRQLFALWALGLLLAAMLLGPLTSVLPWIPFKPSLMYGRRAVGVAALSFALLHVAAYLVSLLRRSWRELYSPGVLWVIGLVLGAAALCGMIALGVTSRDAAVKRMGGRRWKRLHRSVYSLLAIVLLHAIFIGADFGLNRAPDVNGPADAGALVGFLCVSAAWLLLVILRRRAWRWTPRILAQPRA
jgi:sulfoxide reductase heme-binding subunit YedZ